MSTDNKGSPLYLASKDGIFDKSSLVKTDPKNNKYSKLSESIGRLQVEYK